MSDSHNEEWSEESKNSLPQDSSGGGRASEGLGASSLEERALEGELEAETSLVPSSEEVLSSEDQPATTLASLTPELALVFGDVPEGMQLTSLEDLPRQDVALLERALGQGSALASIAGTAYLALNKAKGLYRLSRESQEILASGGQLVMSGDGFLGAIRAAGSSEIIAQARWIPAVGPQAALAAVAATTISMWTMQAELERIGKSVKEVQQSLDRIEQRMDADEQHQVEGLTTTLGRAMRTAEAEGKVTQTTWDPVSDTLKDIDKLKVGIQGRLNVHVESLGEPASKMWMDYLEESKDSLVEDLYRQLYILRLAAQYRWLAAGRAIERAKADPGERESAQGQLDQLRDEMSKDIRAYRDVVDAVWRGLHFNYELKQRQRNLLPWRKDVGETLSGVMEDISPIAQYLELRPSPIEEKGVQGLRGSELNWEDYLHSFQFVLREGEELLALTEVLDAGGVDSRDRLVKNSKMLNIAGQFDVMSGMAKLVGSSALRGTTAVLVLTNERLGVLDQAAFAEDPSAAHWWDLNELEGFRIRKNLQMNRVLGAVVYSALLWRASDGEQTWYFKKDLSSMTVEGFREALDKARSRASQTSLAVIEA